MQEKMQEKRRAGNRSGIDPANVAADINPNDEEDETLYAVQEKFLEGKIQFNRSFDDTLHKFGHNMDFLKY